MPLLKRTEFTEQLSSLIREGFPSLVLFFGERFLCRSSADALQQQLLQNRAGLVSSIDGDQEDSQQTLHKLMSFSLLPGLHIYRVTDSRLFLSKSTGKAIWQKAEQAFQEGKTDQAGKYLSQLCQTSALSENSTLSLSQVEEAHWQELFGFAKPDSCAWADDLWASASGNSKGSTADPAELYLQAFSRGLPPNNLLILTAENVDKRKKLFTFIKEHGLIVDCSVQEGSNTAAQKAQEDILRELMHKTLRQHNKEIDNGALEVLFERIGFHPVAVVMETEKLALYCGESKRITLDDINTIVGRSREDALFELTDHFGKRNLARTLATLHHLLDNGIHDLAILATLRNYVRKMLVYRSLQHRQDPVFRKGLSAKAFQEQYLPRLKEVAPEWAELLGGHPYALYMNFTRATEYSCNLLKHWLDMLLQAEFRLKGAGIPEDIILDHLLISMLRNQAREAQQGSRTPR